MNYNLDTDLFNKNFTPPTKRNEVSYAWGRVLLKAVQYIRDLFFGDYVNGNSSTIVVNYSASSTYQIGDLVYYAVDTFIYECTTISTGNTPTNAAFFSLKSFAFGDRIIHSNKSVYECILSNPSGISPVDTTYWYKLQDSFLGLMERTKANSQILLFEYILNKYFRTSFNYPSSTNDIYIQNNTPSNDSFVFGINESESSAIAITDSEQANFIAESYISQAYNFTIYFPLVQYDLLLPLEPSGTTANKDNIIRFFADNYVCAGLTYNITPY